MHVQNNPYCLAPAANCCHFRDKRQRLVRGGREGRSRRRAPLTPACLSSLGVCLESHALTCTTLSFKVLHLWRKALLQNRSLTTSKIENRHERCGACHQFHAQLTRFFLNCIKMLYICAPHKVLFCSMKEYQPGFSVSGQHIISLISHLH